MQRKLEKKKKRKRQTSVHFKTKKDIQDNSVKLAVTPDDTERCYANQTKNRADFRKFYYSRKCDITNNIHMHCRKERQFLKDDPRRCMVMFVGNCKEGVGSRIKRFLKYGGRWKSIINSQYCSVCFTNEYNCTSQTFLYCYS